VLDSVGVGLLVGVYVGETWIVDISGAGVRTAGWLEVLSICFVATACLVVEQATRMKHTMQVPMTARPLRKQVVPSMLRFPQSRNSG